MEKDIYGRDPHPENNCQRCGSANPTWYAENDLFNKVNGSPNGIMCPCCFELMAKEKGITVFFKPEVYEKS